MPSTALRGDAFPTAAILQPKLKIGEPNDRYELEADRVAEQVMRTPEPRALKRAAVARSAVFTRVQRVCRECEDELSSRPVAVQRMCADGEGELQRQPMEEEEEEETIQAQGIGGRPPQITPRVQAQIDGLRGKGQPLPSSVRDFFEPRFGRDFGTVRVHLGARAVEAARAVNARAFTVGPDVVFASGAYSPGTTEGARLLAHELTHVVQQQGSVLSRGPERIVARQQAAAPEEREGAEEEGAGSEAEPAQPECAPTPLSRQDYLSQPGTSQADFGLTRLDGPVTFPVVHVTRVRGRVRVDPTDAALPPISSVYTQAGSFTEGDAVVPHQEGAECRSGRYPLRWTITRRGARKIQAGEHEHCNDFYHAFDISLHRYAEAVNDLATSHRRFRNRRQVERLLTRRLGVAPADWQDVFRCLACKTEIRDALGWHTPRPRTVPPRLRDMCDFAQAIVSGGSLPHVGRHAPDQIIKDCGEGRNAATDIDAATRGCMAR